MYSSTNTHTHTWNVRNICKIDGRSLAWFRVSIALHVFRCFPLSQSSMSFVSFRFQNYFELHQIFYSASAIYHLKYPSFSHFIFDAWLLGYGISKCNSSFCQTIYMIHQSTAHIYTHTHTHSTYSRSNHALVSILQHAVCEQDSKMKKMMCYNWATNGTHCVSYETWWNVTAQMKNHYIKLSA